jgi:hypothetical protein
MMYCLIVLVPCAVPCHDSVTDILKYEAGLAVKLVGAVGSVFRRAAFETTQALYNDDPAEPRVCMRNLRYAPRVAGGLMPEYVPLVDVDETTMNACQSPHVVPSADSDSCISYPVMLFPAVLAAPDHASESVVSTILGDSTNEVGAPTTEACTCVIVLLTVSSEYTSKLSIVQIPKRDCVPTAVLTLVVILPLDAARLIVLITVHDVHVVPPSVESRRPIMYPFMLDVPADAPDHATVIVSSTKVAGLAVTLVGPFGTVFFRTLPVTFQPELLDSPSEPSVRIWYLR